MNFDNMTGEDLFSLGKNMIDEATQLYNNNQQSIEINNQYILGFELIGKASQKNYLDAHIYLGDYFNHITKDFTSAFYYYEFAANLNDIKGQYMVSIFLNKGLHGIKDQEKAFNIMESLAQKNIPFAQLDLALFYLNGEGTGKNLDKAFEFFKLAAEQGHAIAQNDLGLCYLNGEGTQINYSKALYWFNESRKNNNLVSYYNIGCMLNNGEGISVNIKHAIDCFILGAKLGEVSCLNYVNKNNIEIDQQEEIIIDFDAILKEASEKQMLEEKPLIVKENINNSLSIAIDNKTEPKKIIPSFELLVPYFSCNPNTYTLKDVNELKNGFTPLSLSLEMQDLDLTDEQWDYLLENSTIQTFCYNGKEYSLFSIAMCASNKHFKLNPERLEILIKNCDLKFIDHAGFNNLMYLLISINNIEINIELLEYAIRNSNLQVSTDIGASPLSLILKTFDQIKIYGHISNDLWYYLFKNSNLNTIHYIDNIPHSIPQLINLISNKDWKAYLLEVYNNSSFSSYINTTLH